MAGRDIPRRDGYRLITATGKLLQGVSYVPKIQSAWVAMRLQRNDLVFAPPLSLEQLDTSHRQCSIRELLHLLGHQTGASTAMSGCVNAPDSSCSVRTRFVRKLTSAVEPDDLSSSQIVRVFSSSDTPMLLPSNQILSIFTWLLLMADTQPGLFPERSYCGSVMERQSSMHVPCSNCIDTVLPLSWIPLRPMRHLRLYFCESDMRCELVEVRCGRGGVLPYLTVVSKSTSSAKEKVIEIRT
ncbi:hypothetical protein GY45DRAFT_1319659 [Cubamyces sp. BRFM 1775]|nr:hypothetical protein GY45DRAFT_1319659 [Cubamyces sp. BRFM 1775]